MDGVGASYSFEAYGCESESKVECVFARARRHNTTQSDDYWAVSYGAIPTIAFDAATTPFAAPGSRNHAWT